MKASQVRSPTTVRPAPRVEATFRRGGERTAAPALALAPLAVSGAKKGVDTLVELGKTPVIGWQRTVSYDKGRKNVKHIVEHTSIELRAWELAALGGILVIGYAAFGPQTTTNPPAWYTWPGLVRGVFTGQF